MRYQFNFNNILLYHFDYRCIIIIIVYLSFVSTKIKAINNRQLGYPPISNLLPKSEECTYTEVYDIEVDKWGYLYLCTNTGIYIYDGVKIKLLDPKLPKVDYLQFVKSNNGIIYALPFQNKIVKINCISKNITTDLIEIYRSTENYRTYAIGFDKYNNPLFYIRNKLQKLEKYIYHFNRKELIPITQLTRNYADDSVFVDLLSIPIKFNKKLKPTLDKLTIHEKSIRSKNYIILKNQVLQLKSNFQLDTIFELDSAVVINRFNKSNYDSSLLYVTKGSKYKAYKRSPKQDILLHTDSEITGIVDDKWGNIYISSKNNGVYKFNKSDILSEIIRIKHKSQISKIIALQNKIFLGDANGNLLKFEPGGVLKYIVSTVNNKHIPPKFEIQDSCNFKFINIDGIYKFSNSTIERHANIKSFATDNYIRSFTSKKIDFLVSKRDILITQNEDTISVRPEKVLTCCIKLNDDLMLGSHDGLYRLTNTSQVPSISKVKTETKLDHSPISNLYLHDNKIYILVNNQLLLTTKEFQTLTPILDLKEKIIDIFFFKSHIFIVGSKTLKIYNRNGTLINQKHLPFKLLQDEIECSAIDSSHLYVIQKDFLYKFKIPYLILSDTNFEVIIKNIAYNNKSNYNNYSFQYRPYSNLSFELNILNSSQEDIFYYELITSSTIIQKKPLDPNRIIEFSNLEPNNYKIRLEYQGSYIYEYNFIIEPAWYQKLYFKVLAFVFLGIIVLSIVIFTLKKKENRLKIKYQILTLESKSKTNQLKSHFIFNALTPLQNYIMSNKNNEALVYLHGFSDLMRNILKMNYRTSINLSEEIEFLDTYLTLQRMEKDLKFNFEITYHGSELLKSHLQIPTLIIQPIVENAINYGMNFDENSGFISVNIIEKMNENLVEVLVFDNGKGFSKENYIFSKESMHAINIIEQRLIILGGNKKSNLKYLRFYKTDKGFTVKINIPVNLN